MSFFKTLIAWFLRGFLFVIGGISAALLAVTVSGTVNTFSSGELISASTINANFTALRTAIEGVPDHDAVVVGRSGPQSVPDTTLTALTFNTETVDSSGMHAAGSDQIDIQSPGIYLVVAEIDFDPSATGARVVRIQKNGTAQLYDEAVVANTFTVTHMHLAGVYQFTAGEYVRLLVEQYSTANLGVTPRFSVIKLSN